MAQVQNNIFLRGLSGSVGEQFVIRRTRSGRTIVANMPTFDPEREYTDSQKKQQELFRKATIYAKSAQHQAVYQLKAAGTAATAYNLAVADYFGKPEILDIDISRWTGQPGQKITIKAKDNFMVVRARLVIRPNSEDYDALDGGEAIQSTTDGLLWEFTTTQAITLTEGMQLDAYAYDLPGNLGKDSLVLS